MIYRTSIGLDVHARSISAAAFVPETGEVEERSFGYDAGAVARWAAGLPQPARAVYESGPTGFDLKRSLDGLGLPTCVGAVSKMLKPSGDRVKTDRRDAVFLSRMLAVGNVVECFCPTPEQEAARDLARARADARADLMRARNLLSKMLLRKGIVYQGKSAWTKAHREWLRAIDLPLAAERLVLSEYLQQVVACEQRRDRLDAAIAGLAATDGWRPVVSRLSAVRGIATVAAFSLAAEIGDFSRFPTAPAFMSYLGLVPSEDSSGGKVERGKDHQDGQHARQDAARRGRLAPRAQVEPAAADRGRRAQRDRPGGRPHRRGGQPQAPLEVGEAEGEEGRQVEGQRGRRARARRLRLGPRQLRGLTTADRRGGGSGGRWGEPRTGYAQPPGHARY